MKIISTNMKTVIYQIIIRGADKEQLEWIYDAYLKRDNKRINVSRIDNCECCNNAQIVIEYNTKDDMIKAYRSIDLTNVPDSVNVSYEIDRETIPKAMEEIIKKHTDKYK